MKVFKSVLVGLVVLVAATVAVGFMMPSAFRIERSTVIKAPAGKVYALVADPREWKRWSVWNQRDPAMKITYSGAPSGAGAGWSWESRSEGNGSMTFTKAEPDRLIDYALSFPDMGMASRGVLELTPQDGGVAIRWTNEGDVGRNPLMHLMVPFLDGMVGADFAAGLANLKALAERP